jgi:trans-2,3-dihydro-3-hydroxyanthranilate isomerase
MTRVRYHTVDVFTNRLFGGNQLAVIPDARGLSTGQMASIAREFNFSETTFVLPPADPSHTRRVRIFTPGGELDFAGHPTVGTAHLLAATGEVALEGTTTRIVLEEGVGPVPVTITATEGVPVFCQLSVARLPDSLAAPADARTLARLVSLDESDIIPGAEPVSISCGTPFLFLPLKDPGAVTRSRPRSDLFEDVLGGYRTQMMMVFAEKPDDPERIHARMFAPTMGVPEDPATGSAAVGLGAWVARRRGAADGTLRLTVEQGVEMGRASELFVEVDVAGGAVSGVRVGGETVLVSEGTMRVG